MSIPLIYLDNAATTRPSEAAIAAMSEALHTFGNPSSLHAVGQSAARLLAKARSQVAAALGVRAPRPGELVFTGSGTEASSLAILGTAYAKERRHARRILTTDSEHPSVEEAMRRLEAAGLEVIRIPTRGGALDTEAALRALEEPTLLVSMMLVSNETGARYEVEKVFAAAKKKDPRTVTHCDAVQGFLKLPFTPASLSADLVTISAHKIHGPKGVGALYIHPEILKTKRIIPWTVGGGQESGLRSGTENLPGICGFGAAAEAGLATRAADIAHMAALRDALEGKLSALEVTINRPAGGRAPHIVSVTLPGIKSQTMLNYLSARGICVSSGSACSSHSRNLSPTLLAFGLTPAAADTTLRISLSADSTEPELDALVAALTEGIAGLVRKK